MQNLKTNMNIGELDKGNKQKNEICSTECRQTEKFIMLSVEIRT